MTAIWHEIPFHVIRRFGGHSLGRPITAGETQMSIIQEKIGTWLREHGYPLEMKVAGVLQSLRVHADHHRVYEDPVTGKSREIDVMGYLDHRNLSVHLVLECKHSRDKPWVLFCTGNPVLTHRGYVNSAPCTPEAETVLTELADLNSVQSMSMFARPPLVGFRLIRAYTENQDPAFHAVSGLASACTSTAREIGQHGHRVVYVPVVVVDTPLVQCHLPNAADDLQILQVSQGLLLHVHGGGRFVIIHIVHVDQLSTFVAEVQRDCEALAGLVPAKRAGREPRA